MRRKRKYGDFRLLDNPGEIGIRTIGIEVIIISQCKTVNPRRSMLVSNSTQQFRMDGYSYSLQANNRAALAGINAVQNIVHM